MLLRCLNCTGHCVCHAELHVVHNVCRICQLKNVFLNGDLWLNLIHIQNKTCSTGQSGHKWRCSKEESVNSHWTCFTFQFKEINGECHFIGFCTICNLFEIYCLKLFSTNDWPLSDTPGVLQVSAHHWVSLLLVYAIVKFYDKIYIISNNGYTLRCCG